MKYQAPSKDLFIRNRKRFAAQMQPNTVAVFHSNDLVNDNADSYYRFVQNSNMYYLSGLDQEEVVLVLFPDAPLEEWKEMLFIRKTSEQIQIWEGWKYSKEEATEASGIEHIHYYGEFDPFFRKMSAHFDGIYLDLNEHEKSPPGTFTAGHRLATEIARKYPLHRLLRAAPILTDLRVIKGPEELEQMKTAIAITEKAFLRVGRFVRPGVYEYEVEAEVMHAFLRNRATGPAYESIIASGRNACVLHYIANNAVCADGDLLLMDFGAEYGNYSADLTRTIPVNGRFNRRQRAVYDACLRVFKQAREMLVPGRKLDEFNEAVGLIMEEELLGLGLIGKEDVAKQDPDWPAYKRYFMHGTSHHLGLDTHDVNNRYAEFKAGMIFTCEPGIYILEEEIGVRIENDILITEKGPVDLMASIPIEADEIEALMAEKQ
jgi:Xaa-Pro aminopeptidase